MVVHAFPAAKLGALVIKQISKPIANAVKNQAKSSPVFRRYVCLPPAKFYHWCEVKLKMWLLHLGQPVNITIPNETALIDLGANLLGEGVIFVIAAGILVNEYNRSSRKEAEKEAKRLAELERLQDSLRDLFIQSEEQGAHIRELTRKLLELEPVLTTKTDTSKSPEIDEPPRPTAPSPPPSSIFFDSKNLPVLPEEDALKDVNLMNKPQQKYSHKCGVLSAALNLVEAEFLRRDSADEEIGILNIALNHLYKDVYNKPLPM